MLDVGRHPNIELMAYSEVEKVEGSAGCFKVQVRKKARYVDQAKCTGCGACAESCPTLVTDLYNEGHSKRKAIYSWFAQGIPSTHAIDTEHCRVFQGKKCGICQKKCEANAVDFEQKDEVVELEIGSIIAASGYTVFNPGKIHEYRYNELPNVVTAMEFERFLSASGPTHGHIDRPSDVAVLHEIETLEKQENKAAKGLARLEEKYGEKSAEFYKRYSSGEAEADDSQKQWAAKYEEYLPLRSRLEELKQKAESFTTARKLAFIQCVGSRDLRFYPFCSGFCCMHSIKEAIIAHEHDNETTSVIFGMDIRAVGKGFDEYKVRGNNNSNITYRRSRVAEIQNGPDDRPVLVYEDTQKQVVQREEFDLVVLATACAPADGVKDLAEILGIEINRFGFFKTSPENPLDTTKEGIFVCGCAHSPMDIPESVAQASSAASRAVQTVTVSPQELLKVS
ncbi:CoB--CoM heterodisulfide reductase iron-sulfur subunit A family protein [Desulfopila inferna]|nr:4Fe-4S binding protein [Desulfopila inferna]MBM9606506.1 CoB--CoM heterodisulfide reductase iron-sulfur subunit A family protein [Desulfopila inferna]